MLQAPRAQPGKQQSNKHDPAALKRPYSLSKGIRRHQHCQRMRHRWWALYLQALHLRALHLRALHLRALHL